MDFSQRLGKTSGFFFAVAEKNKSIFLHNLQRQVGVLKWQAETFCMILPDVPKLFIVVSDQAFSIFPMIFSVVLLEDVIVED